MTVGVIRTGNSTGIGTGTTKTEISPSAGLFMPSDGRALLAVKPTMALLTPTISESVSARLDVESADVRNMGPYEVLFAPIGLPLNGGASFTGMETWETNAPLSGGEALHLHATALVANSVAPEAMAFVIVSNDMRDLMGKMQRHAKLGTFTGTGTTADTDVAGTKYSFSTLRREIIPDGRGGQVEIGGKIVELFGEFHPKANVTGNFFIGEIKYTSSEFVDNFPQSLPLYPMTLSGSGATQGYLIPGVSRQKVLIPVKPGQVNIQDYLNFGGVITTNAGSFISGVVYE